MVMYYGVPDKEEIFLGNNDLITFTIYSDEALTTPKDITGATFKYTAKERATDTSFLFQIAGAILVAANGTLTVTFQVAHTSSLDAGKYAVDLEMTLGGGTFTCYVGYLDIMQVVT